jgi:modulator of FtsH protease
MQLFPMEPWVPYLTAIAAAGATLTGLVFVAVSINLAAILKQSWLTDRAAESLLQLVGSVLLATMPLIPSQRPEFLGTEILVISGLLWFFQSYVQLRYLRSGVSHPIHWRLVRVVQTQLAYIPFFVGGILLLGRSPAGPYWMVPGLIFSLLAGVANAWVLLVEILR